MIDCLNFLKFINKKIFQMSQHLVFCFKVIGKYEKYAYYSINLSKNGRNMLNPMISCILCFPFLIVNIKSIIIIITAIIKVSKLVCTVLQQRGQREGRVASHP
jgi:hypothetical protein